MTRLFSYCIPVDDGAAPNPFWGLCTLCICKPKIRRVAQVGDWIVGTGSRRSPIGDISGHVVYAMRVTKKLTMEQYDAFARKYCAKKIPDWVSRDERRWLGDAIYDFSTNPPILRQSVHSEADRRRDLSGAYALISEHFFYFGDKPRQLPLRLQAIAMQRQGHRSRANDALVQPFLQWIHGLRLAPAHLYGNPQRCLWEDSPSSENCTRRKAKNRSQGLALLKRKHESPAVGQSSHKASNRPKKTIC